MSDKVVTLLRPPVIFSESSFSVPITPPLAIAYLTAALEKAGFAVQPIDAIGEDIRHIEDKSRRRRAQGMSFSQIVQRISPRTDVLGISVMFSQEWPLIRELIRLIRTAHPHLIIIAGGEHITALPEFCLRDCPELDYCALGEGEQTLVEFVSTIRSGGKPDDVGGLCHRGTNGITRTLPRPRPKNLSELPWPAWDKLPLEVYLAAGFGNGINNGRNMPILATRGCPYECTFCSNPIMYQRRYQMRPPGDVIAEIKHYITHYRADFIEFYDLTAIVQKKWIVEFCQLYLANDLKVGWSLPSGTRSEALDAEVLELLYRTRCRYLVYAPESGSKVTLKEIKKEVHLDRLVQSVRQAVRLGINTRCNLVVGFPKETRRDLFQTLKFQFKLAWLGVDDAPLYTFSPYPGSSLFEYLRSTGQIKELDEEYFDRLLAQMDLGVDQTYCENISGKALRFYRILGMSLFYTFSYLLRPWRLWRSWHNIFVRKQTSTVFEQRLLEMIKRRTETG